MIEDRHQQDLIDKFVELVEFLNRANQVVALEEWRGLNLTIPQIKTLMLLRYAGQVRMGGIAKYLDSTVSATTNIVQRLFDKGLVQRGFDPDDRRVVACELTEKGRETIDNFWYVGRLRVEPILQRLDADQLEAVIASLELLRETVEEIHRSNCAPDRADFGTPRSRRQALA